MAVEIELYQIKKDSDDPIKLSITIGHGQLGVTRIYKGVNPVAPDMVGSFTDFNVGSNSELADQNRKIDISVEDVNPITDETSVTIKLEGGAEDKTYELKPIIVEESGGYAFYFTVFYFYS